MPSVRRAFPIHVAPAELLTTMALSIATQSYPTFPVGLLMAAVQVKHVLPLKIQIVRFGIWPFTVLGLESKPTTRGKHDENKMMRLQYLTARSSLRCRVSSRVQNETQGVVLHTHSNNILLVLLRAYTRRLLTPRTALFGSLNLGPKKV